MEFELGWQRAREQGVRTSEIGPQLSIGLRDPLDLIVRPTGLAVQGGDTSGTVRGFGDADVGIKWRFAESDAVSFALRADVFLPTGSESRGLGAPGTAYRALLVATTEIGPWAFHANAAYTRAPAAADARRDLGFLSAASVWSLNEAVRFSFELTGTSPSPREEQRWAMAARVGAMFNVTPSFKLDAGYEHRLNARGPDSIVLAGMTYHW